MTRRRDEAAELHGKAEPNGEYAGAARPACEDDDQTTYILVTGANAGLGFGTCCRLADAFLRAHAAPATLHLVLGTRHAATGAHATAALQQHLTTLPLELQPGRVRTSVACFDLTDLPAVLAGAAALRARLPRLDALVCNAGVSAFAGIHWPRAVWAVLTDPLAACTQPGYYLGAVGELVPPQQARRETDGGDGDALVGGGRRADGARQVRGDAGPEPALGRTFCANVFGHYLLAAHLAPLLRRGRAPAWPAGASAGSSGSGRASGGRIIFVSSIETVAAAYRPDDVQGLAAPQAYSSSKRLTDLLALTATAPACRSAVAAFLRGVPAAKAASTSTSNKTADEAAAATAASDENDDNDSDELAALPRIYLSHPGVVATDIVPLSAPLRYAKLAAFHLCRWLGSPWHTLWPYTGAAAAAWLALAPARELTRLERDPPLSPAAAAAAAAATATDLSDGKSGANSKLSEAEKEMMEEEDGAVVADQVGFDARCKRHVCAGGRAKWGAATDRRGRGSVTRTWVEGWGLGGEAAEGRAEFEELGARAWADMEALRALWEERLGVPGPGQVEET